MAIVVLLAAGSGTRFDSAVPKQLLDLGGKSLFEHAVTAFDHHPEINEIVVITSKHLITEIGNLANHCSKKTTQILEGGQTRASSTYVGINSISSSENPKVLIHDAARPFVSRDLITQSLDALNQFDAVSPVMPVKETIFETVKDEVISIPDRTKYVRAQTPQGFRLETIKAAHEQLNADESFTPTDDCGIVMKYLPNTSIGVVDGDEKNIKITYPIDMILAKAIYDETNNF